MTWRILAIEDSFDSRRIVGDLLVSAGHEFLEAADGVAGLAAASEHRPDLILLDIQLPLIGGYEVARRLKSNPDLQRIPIIAMTSHDSAGSELLARQAGCDGYVAKPFNPQTILSTIRGFLTTA